MKAAPTDLYPERVDSLLSGDLYSPKFGTHTALSPDILDQLGYYSLFPELRPQPGGKVDSKRANRRRYKRSYTWQDAAQYFVELQPTYAMMQARFNLKSPTTVWRMTIHPDFIIAVRNLGYTGKITLNRKRTPGSGFNRTGHVGVVKQNKQIYKDALHLYCLLNARSVRKRDIVTTLLSVHKSITETTIRRWIRRWEESV